MSPAHRARGRRDRRRGPDPRRRRPERRARPADEGGGRAPGEGDRRAARGDATRSRRRWPASAPTPRPSRSWRGSISAWSDGARRCTSCRRPPRAAEAHGRRPDRPVPRRALPQRPGRLQAGTRLEGHGHHRAPSSAALTARGTALPSEQALEARRARADLPPPRPAFQEPDIAGTLHGAGRARGTRTGACTWSPSPRRTRSARRTRPWPSAPASWCDASATPCRRTSRSASASSACPGPAARRTSSTGRCGPRRSREILGDDVTPSRVFVGVSDADSIPDPDTYRWIARQELWDRARSPTRA